jgi:asparagine synthetase B (glutamine-hydrolysing)
VFLVASTYYPVRNLLKGLNAQQFELRCSKILTLVTDGFLSTYLKEPRRFSVIESPLVNSPNLEKMIFSQVTIDTTDNSLRLFRSTMAGRPIYYHLNREGEFFCSTHISMLRKVGVPIEEDTEALPEFFVYRYVMPPRSLYRNIRQVLAGSCVHFTLGDGRYKIIKVDRYHPPRPQNDKSKNIHDVANRVVSILNQTIHPLHTASNRVAFLLSGGLDSSILFEICRNNFDLESTFSTGYPLQNPKLNLEKQYACSAAESFGVRHCYYEATIRDYLYEFLGAISAAEEPLHHLQSVLLYLLFKRGMPQTKDIVISGQGADGIFGLGLHNLLFLGEKKIFRLISLSLLAGLAQLAGHASVKAQQVASTLNKLRRKNFSLSDPNNITWLLGAYGSSEWASRHFKVNSADIIRGRYDSVEPFKERSLYDIISLLDFLGDVSVTAALWSKLGEDQKKIVYYPYNSLPMLDHLYGLPWDIKLEEPKNVLRKVASHLNIPKFIVNRPKSGFGIEPEHWAVRGGWFEPLIPLAAKVFLKKDISDLQSTNLDTARTFWNVLNYSIWKRLVIDNEPLEVLSSELEESILETSSVSHKA